MIDVEIQKRRGAGHLCGRDGREEVVRQDQRFEIKVVGKSIP
jgi:hypothetical protein